MRIFLGTQPRTLDGYIIKVDYTEQKKLAAAVSVGTKKLVMRKELEK